MKKAYDVIIIGGGIIGCATAFELAKRGITDILLIEKRFLTSGATGRCGAGIRQQWGSELNARIARKVPISLNIWKNIPAIRAAAVSIRAAIFWLLIQKKNGHNFRKTSKSSINSALIPVPSI